MDKNTIIISFSSNTVFSANPILTPPEFSEPQSADASLNILPIDVKRKRKEAAERARLIQSIAAAAQHLVKPSSNR